LASWPDVGSDALRCHLALLLHRSGKRAASPLTGAVKIAIVAQAIKTRLDRNKPRSVRSCAQQWHIREYLANRPPVASATVIHHYLSLLRVLRQRKNQRGEITGWFWTEFRNGVVRAENSYKKFQRSWIRRERFMRKVRRHPEKK